MEGARCLGLGWKAKWTEHTQEGEQIAIAQGEEEGTHIKHVPQWEIDAEERRKAEEHWQLVKKSFKRSWRPPGLHGTH